MFECKDSKTILRLLLVSFLSRICRVRVDVVSSFFGMLSGCRLFTCGTRGIVFYSSRSPAPFALTNVGKITVLAFNSVNDACYSFFRWTVLRFFEDRCRCAYWLKGSIYVELLQCEFYPVRYPFYIGYHGKANRVRMVVLRNRPWLGSIFNEFGGISIDL